jgi:hypothetical protein
MSALPFILGAIFGGTLMAFVVGMSDRRDKLVHDMRARIRSLRAESRIHESNATRNLELMLDWRLRAMNAEYAIEDLRRIYANPNCRAEVEAQIGDSVWDALSVEPLPEAA